MIAFSASMRVHNFFHSSLLKKYAPDPNDIIDWTVILVENEGDLQVEPVCIMDYKVKVIWRKSIEMIKVQWNCYSPQNATWEHEETMREEYPQIFVNFEENRR
jgi:hypothetical protein